MDRSEEYRTWIDLADTDYRSAEFLTGMIPVPGEIICFHCQQSAEKYLKAFLVFQGIPFEKTHNLTALLKECILVDTEFEILKVPCARLNVYGVEIRYPTNLSIDTPDIDLAIKDAQAVKTTILKKIGA